MTYQTPHRKSNGKVHPGPPDAYERWRVPPSAPVLQEAGPAGAPAETLLQRIWAHQRLRREALATFDGRPLTVLHPGFPNPEGGPDFRDAVLRFGESAPTSGDVEVDLRPAAWRQHGHDRNPAFRAVCLHVVWSAPAGEALPLPTLALADVLDAPLDQLQDQLAAADPTALPAAWHGACAAPLATLAPETLTALLDQAALTRLRLKTARFAAHARLVGWSRALRTGLLGALGYKHNVWPMRRLAELSDLLLAELDARPPDPFEIQVRLLGLAGLLPEPAAARHPAARAWLRRAWDGWWRWREGLADHLLPSTVWRLHGTRPANHPQRRLALAAHWLATPAWEDRWTAWLADRPEPRHAVATLHRLLLPGADPFWERHWTVNSAPLPAPRPLLGAARATDLAINVLLPWLLARAEAGAEPGWAGHVRRLCLAWPAGQDNAVLRLARQRLLAGRPLPRPLRAASQQGLLQIAADFCAASNALCTGCRFPECVRSFAADAVPPAPASPSTPSPPPHEVRPPGP